MFRAACAALLALALLSAAASAQGRRGFDRAFDRGFGLAADQWCREITRGGRDAHCDVREDTLTGITVLDLDTGGNGGIAVKGADRSDVRLRYRITAWGDDPGDARQLASRVRVTTSGGRVRADGPRGGSRSGSWAVSFEAEVPRALALELTSRNGGIRIDGVTGRTHAQTVNGGIALRDVSGDVRGRTTNGGISAELDGSGWEGVGLDVATVNGGITLRFPRDYSAELEAQTSNGGINIDFPITVQGRLTNLHRRMHTTLGRGGAPVRVRTVNGGVRIERR